MDRYVIFGHNGLNRRSDYESALHCAAELVRNEWKRTGEIGACFAIVFDMLNRNRVVCWLTDDFEVKYRKLF